jgi:hypothetical protein
VIIKKKSTSFDVTVSLKRNNTASLDSETDLGYGYGRNVQNLTIENYEEKKKM